MKLSYSKMQKYEQCPALYDFHYNKKLRSKYIGSPLFFGSAIDDAVGVLKLPLKKKLTKKEKEIKDNHTALDMFKSRMTWMQHNKEQINIQTYPYVNYSKADIDTTNLKDEDMEQINGRFFDEPYDRKGLQEYAEYTHKQIKLQKKVEKEDFIAYNQICWMSLYRKGELIIQKYEEEIIPQIEEIVSLQEEICITNDNGDEITGFIDDVRIYKDEPNVYYINDDKTSSKPYKQEQLDESPQLSTYAWYKDIPNVSYTVMEKNIRKREPRVRINILKGISNSEYKDEVLDNYENTLHLINEGNFEPNFDSGCKFYGAKCLYHDICHKGTMPDYIVDMSKNTEDNSGN